jgi:hypothetical protein
MIYLLLEKRGKMFRPKNFEVVNPRYYNPTDVLYNLQEKRVSADEVRNKGSLMFEYL